MFGLLSLAFLYSNALIDIRVVRMSIEKLLGSFLNRVIVYLVIEASIQMIVAVAGASGEAGILVGGVAIGAFILVELIHAIGRVKAQF